MPKKMDIMEIADVDSFGVEGSCVPEVFHTCNHLSSVWGQIRLRQPLNVTVVMKQEASC